MVDRLRFYIPDHENAKEVPCLRVRIMDISGGFLLYGPKMWLILERKLTGINLRGAAVTGADSKL
jgi:hypothetical protein